MYRKEQFNKEWAQSKSEAEFIAEFKGHPVLALSDAELSAAYYEVTGKVKPEAKPAVPSGPDKFSKN